MWPTNWTKIESETPELLERWRGVRGQTWEYSMSHARLIVRFYRAGQSASLFLFCTNCSVVQFRDGWLEINVQIKLTKNNGNQTYTITDRDYFHVVCGYAGLAETDNYSVRLQDQL